MAFKIGSSEIFHRRVNPLPACHLALCRISQLFDGVSSISFLYTICFAPSEGKIVDRNGKGFLYRVFMRPPPSVLIPSISVARTYGTTVHVSCQSVLPTTYMHDVGPGLDQNSISEGRGHAFGRKKLSVRLVSPENSVCGCRDHCGSGYGERGSDVLASRTAPSRSRARYCCAPKTQRLNG